MAQKALMNVGVVGRQTSLKAVTLCYTNYYIMSSIYTPTTVNQVLLKFG